MIRAALIAIVALAFAAPALAHPHVWVTMHTELVYAPDGNITGDQPRTGPSTTCSRPLPRRGWTSKVKGKFTREELAPLAKVNVESLKEYDYFTYVTADGKKVQLGDPAPGYWLDYNNQILTLHFTLPFKTPVKAKYLKIEIYDPTIFVDFEWAKNDPVHIVDFPHGCKADVVLPHEMTYAEGQELSNEALAATFNLGREFRQQDSDQLSVVKLESRSRGGVHARGILRK